MAGPSRLPRTRLNFWLQPERCGFWQIMRRLAGALRWGAPIGESRHAREDPVRFGQVISMGFPTSTIFGWHRRRRPVPDELPDVLPHELLGPDGELLPAVRDWIHERDRRRPRLLLHFFGLFGQQGPLPSSWTQRALWQERKHDHVLSDFADVLHHRLVTVLYRAWARGQPGAGLHAGQEDPCAGDAFARRSSALLGLRAGDFGRAEAALAVSRLGSAAQLARQNRDAVGLEEALEAFFAHRFRVVQFVGEWLRIPAGELSRLARDDGNCLLGRTLVLGDRFRSCQDKFRIEVGPLSWSEFEALLPVADAPSGTLQRLIDIVRMWSGYHLHWDLLLVLHKDEVPPLRLDRGARLGWTSWLRSVPFVADARDTVLEPTALGSRHMTNASSGSGLAHG